MVDHADDRGAPGAEGQDGGAEGGGGERVAKALARAGVASRRDVERFIAAGRVALNGRVLDTPAVKVGAGDILTVDGAVVGGPEAARVWRHHKPAGLITSHGDPAGRATVFDHLPADLPRVISIGRLDLATEGLLLLTNDGELARRLELPDNGWRRVYRARAHGRADQARLDTLRDGVTIEGVRYGPVEARLDKATGKGAVGRGRVSDAPANLWITVTVAEGKNREVRRVLEHLGLKVNRLIRVAYGPFALGELTPGEVEEIAPRVLREQLEGLVPPGSLPTGNRRPGPPTRGAPPLPVQAAPARPQEPRAGPQGRSARPLGPQAPRGAGPRGRDEARGGKPAPRSSGAAGRVSGAWSPPGERPSRAGGPAGAGGKAGAKPARGGPSPGRARPAAGPAAKRFGDDRAGDGVGPRGRSAAAPARPPRGAAGPRPRAEDGAEPGRDARPERGPRPTSAPTSRPRPGAGGGVAAKGKGGAARPGQGGSGRPARTRRVATPTAPGPAWSWPRPCDAARGASPARRGRAGPLARTDR